MVVIIKVYAKKSSQTNKEERITNQRLKTVPTKHYTETKKNEHYETQEKYVLSNGDVLLKLPSSTVNALSKC